ncbi:MAG TPA: hypothetical protein VGI60_01770 [Chthoniobacterales bacterium]|jgi:hypothetical protein
MKAPKQYSLLLIFGAIFGFVSVIFGFLGLFHNSVGLPDWLEFPFSLISVVSIWIVVWLQRCAKKRGDPGLSPITPALTRGRTWLFILAFFLTCFAWPFMPPNLHGGVELPLHERFIIAAAVFVVLLPLVIIILRPGKGT